LFCGLSLFLDIPFSLYYFYFLNNHALAFDSRMFYINRLGFLQFLKSLSLFIAINN